MRCRNLSSRTCADVPRPRYLTHNASSTAAHARAAFGKNRQRQFVVGFLLAPYRGLDSASKHAVEGLSETPDHEVRQFGVRVLLVEPSYTKPGLDINAPQAASKIPVYDASRAIVKNANDAAAPDSVAATIVDAAFGP